LASLVKKIDQNGTAPNTFVIFSSADGLDKQLRGMAEQEGLHRVSLCIGAPPQRYELSKEADVTVIIYSRQSGPPRSQNVVANFALRKGELNEAKIDAIVEALSKAR